MSRQFFEAVDHGQIECIDTFVTENLGNFAESNISPYEIVETIGKYATQPLCEATEARAVARINNARIWGDGLGTRT